MDAGGMLQAIEACFSARYALALYIILEFGLGAHVSLMGAVVEGSRFGRSI